MNLRQGWGVVHDGGVALRKDESVFVGDSRFRDYFRLLLHPEKFVMYRFLGKAIRKQRRKRNLIKQPFKILVVGCGTGGMMVDLKKKFGRDVEVVGLDETKLQLDLAKKHIKACGVWPKVRWYDGKTIPFGNKSFDSVCSFGTFARVEDGKAWLRELRSVLRIGGVLALYTETTYGRHAFLRRYFLRRGLDTRKHSKNFILTCSKEELMEPLKKLKFRVHKVYGVGVLSFLLEPGEFIFQRNKRFWFFRLLNRSLVWVKKNTWSFSFRCVRVLQFFLMVLFGKWVDGEGVVVLAYRQKLEIRD